MYEPLQKKSNKIKRVKSEDTNPPGHQRNQVLSLCCGFNGYMYIYMYEKLRTHFSRRHRRIWSDLVDSQADMSLSWVHGLNIYYLALTIVLYLTAYYIKSSSKGIHRV